MSSPDRIHRLIRLLSLLQSGRSLGSAQLADLCQVSRRTIFRDIKTLQESGVQIQYQEPTQGYSLASHYYLPPMDLQLDETLSLLLLCQELGDEGQGIPFQSSAREAGFKLLSNLPQHLRDYVGELSSAITLRLDASGNSPDSEPHFERIIQAISEKRRIRIAYDCFTDQQEIQTLISPYRLLFSRRSWYLIGRSSLHAEDRMFHVGRIQHSKLTEDTYEIPAHFSLERFLGNAWHLIRNPREKHRVIVRFKPRVARNVSEVNWHKTQELHWNDDSSLDFVVNVEGLSEIVWWILGYGDQAEVLEPVQLRQMIQEHVQNMVQIYEQVST